MCTTEYRLQALINEWNHLDGLINEIESRYYSTPLIVVTFLAAANYFDTSGNYSIESVSEIVIVVSAAILSYMTYEFRRVAYLRGALRKIESRINNVTGEDLYNWNSHIVPKYLGNSWMNYLVPIVLGLAFVIVDGHAFASMFEHGNYLIGVALAIFCLLVVCLCIASLFYNEAVSKAVENDEQVDSWRAGGFKGRIERD